jgi:hypothetical protein
MFEKNGFFELDGHFEVSYAAFHFDEKELIFDLAFEERL